MSNVHHGNNPVKSNLTDALDVLVEEQIRNWRLINTGANLVTRDQAEQLLHADSSIGEWTTGDVEIYHPDQWCAWVDDWRWVPSDAPPDERELEMVLTGVEEERAILDLEYEEAVEEMDIEEFHHWLDSLEPTCGELEMRDLTDCGMGHLS